MPQPPVIIVPYDPAWPSLFEAERELIEGQIARFIVGGIEHIGSTAVPGLAAKPVIDIMAGVDSLEASRDAITLLEPIDYCYFPYKADVMHWFCKPSDAERTHHLHLVPFRSQLWHERIAFRDHLRAHPDAAAAYATLKQQLAQRYRGDRETYTDAKTAFIQAIVTAKS
ncbi:MAG TPA: GrpB family protein [Kofleriaceae bacterium]